MVVVVVELEEESVVKEGDPSGQTRTPVRVRLLRALAGTGVLKHGWVVGTGLDGSGFSGADCLGLSEVVVTVGMGAENSEKESSTKWDSHSKSATSSCKKFKTFVQQPTHTTQQPQKKKKGFFLFF